MQPLHMFSILLVSFVLCIASAAQQPVPQSSPQASALVLRAISSLTGGVTVTDVSIAATAARTAGSDPETGTANLRGMLLGMGRVDLTLPSGQYSEARSESDNGAAGAWSGPSTSVTPMALHNLWTPAAWFFPALILEDEASRSDGYFTYIGQETLNGSPVQHVRFERSPAAASPSDAPLLTNLTTVDIYLDPSSLLLICPISLRTRSYDVLASAHLC
jgi:hypothetical protein